MKSPEKEIEAVVKTVEKSVNTVEITAEKLSRPIRHTLLRRFPILAVLVITFGVTATTTATQLLYAKIELFVRYPSILLFLGLGALLIMGKLHQKLS